MMESIILFTLCYILFCVCFVFPPPEFVSVGLTVESIFSFWLKDEATYFIHYHIKRTVVTLLTHSFFPLGYVLGIKYISPENSAWDQSIFLNFLFITSFTILMVTTLVILKWHYSGWRNHPIAKNLQKFTTSESDINGIARDINAEYRSINKIVIKCSARNKVVVTDNWIIKISPYTMNLAHQSDASLVVSSSDQHLYVPDRPEGSQYLRINVKSSRPSVNEFQIRINSSDFKDLQEKIFRPINIMDDVVVQGNLTDCFLKVFKEQVKENPTVLAPDNLDVCIGCHLATPNVKLMMSCGYTSGPDKCSVCYCKPLWCVDCMGKWFASRQDKEKPESWLSSKCTCPMCRSTFCVLDVCPLVPSEKGNQS